MTLTQKTLLFFVFFVIFCWHSFELSSHFNMSFLRTNFYVLHNSVIELPKTTACLFFAIYILVVDFSLSGATVLTAASGAIFSYPLAVIMFSFASSIGTKCASLMSKIFPKDWVKHQFPVQLKKIKLGWTRDKTFYFPSKCLTPISFFSPLILLRGCCQLVLFDSTGFHS